MKKGFWMFPISAVWLILVYIAASYTSLHAHDWFACTEVHEYSCALSVAGVMVWIFIGIGGVGAFAYQIFDS